MSNKKDFKQFCENNMGFTPSHFQLEIFEKLKDNKNIVIMPRRSTGKSYLALSIKLFQDKLKAEAKRVERN